MKKLRMINRRLTIAALSGAVLGMAAEPAFAANLLVNSGFEDPITNDGPPFVGSWEGFSAGAGASSSNSAAMPRSGAQHLHLTIDTVPNSFAGAFQDVGGLLAGDEFIFAGWHKSTTDLAGLGIVEVRIEWRDSVGDFEISRTPTLHPLSPTSDYSMFSLTASTPAGADSARLVYAIQTFGGGGDRNNTVFVDDTSFQSTSVSVPDGGTTALLGLIAFGGLGVARRFLRS